MLDGHDQPASERARRVRAAWCAKNREKVKASNAKYYAENPDKVKAINAEYRAKNRPKVSARKAEYRSKNLEKVKASNAKHSLGLSQSYVAGTLGMRVGELTPLLLELKRQQLTLRRMARQLKKASNESSKNPR